jgi:hypothetical protein
MRFKPPNCKRLQGAAEARRWAHRRTFVLHVPDNKADAVPCELIQTFQPIGRLSDLFNDHERNVVIGGQSFREVIYLIEDIL